MLVGRGAVHAGDGLQQGVIGEFAIEIHHLADRGIKAGEEHVCHDQQRERVLAHRFQEVFDRGFVIGGIGPFSVNIFIIVLSRDDHGGFRCAWDLIQFLLVKHSRSSAARHQDPLEAVGQDCAAEVIHQIEPHPFQALGCLKNGPFGAVCALDLCLLLWRFIGEIAIEEGIEGITGDLGFGFAAFVEDLHGGAIDHGLLDGVGVDVGAELVGGGFLLYLHQRCASEGDLGGIGQGGVDGSAE